MSTITSSDGRFFVVPQCVSWLEAATVASSSGGALAQLSSDTLAQLTFGPDAFADVPVCADNGHPDTGPIAWIGGWNGGTPPHTVLGVNLVTRQVYADSCNSACPWTRLVLAEKQVSAGIRPGVSQRSRTKANPR
jgi:hypothetical protein